MSLTAQTTAPPVAPRKPKTLEAHGDSRTDPYFWLREKTSPEVIKYLEDENRYTEATMAGTDELQKKLFEEIRSRVKEDDLSVPVKIDGFFYYTRTEKGKQYAIYCRKKGSLDAAEQVLVDANTLAEGKKYFRIGVFKVSPDHKLLAYSTDYEGDEVYTLRFRNLDTGADLAETVPGTYYSVQWAADNKTLFYNVVDPTTKRPYRLFRHTLGAAGQNDTLIYEEKDEAFTLELDKTKSREFLLMQLNSATTSEVRYLRASDPAGAFAILEPRRKEVEYDVAHHGDHFYIRVNDAGRNFRLVKAPVKSPGRPQWQEVQPHRESVLIEGVDAFRDHLVLVERENGLRKLRIDPFTAQQKSHYVEFQEPAYTVIPADNPDFNTSVLRYTYTSLVTPNSVYDYDMTARTQTLMKRQDVLGGYDPARYASERLYATAKDGVKVPISVVYRKDFVKNGEAPLLLTGYGAYGITTEAGFSSARLSLLDRGFAIALAHIRGGQEMGKKWHDDGRMLNKKNSFTDFIACAEHLIAAKYTKPSRLAILGGSAGGLLMGAVVNLRPDLFGAVIAKVPFVDVINTMSDASLPLTVGEYEEWGNPADKKYYEYMRSYSPYDNVTGKLYPNMLVTAGLNDPRVSYWEPAKWVARLRAVKEDKNILLLKTNMGAGHFGASGRYEQMKETAFDYAFLLKVFGMATPPAAR